MMSASFPDASSRPLPPYRGILAVDAERFSSNPSAALPNLSSDIPDLLERALSRCDLEGVWADRRFPQSTGDGYLLGIPPEHLPFLVDPLLDSLHHVLVEHDRTLRSINRALRLRLRVSIHVGPVPDSNDERRDGTSTPTIETFRLLDSRPVRQALNTSSPDLTLLAAVVSQRVFEDVVLAGFTGLHPDRFTPVTADVPRKDFVQPAWLYLPRGSRHSNAPAQDDRPSRGETSPQPALSGRRGSSVIFNGPVGQSISGEHVEGIRQVLNLGTLGPNAQEDQP
jgi:hypothetical protein